MTCTIPGCPKRAWGKQQTCSAHTTPSAAVIRAVWRYVSAHPRASTGDMEDDLHISRSTAHRALCALEQRGAIKRTAGSARSIVVKPVITCAGQPYRVMWMKL